MHRLVESIGLAPRTRRLRGVPAGVLTLWLLLGVLACGPGDAEPEAGPTFSQVDSSGVVLSITSRGAAYAPLGWTVDFEPDLVLGRGDSPSRVFHRVQGIQGIEDDGVLVVDGGSQELRFYDSGGRLVKRAGGPGEGPGEFGDPVLVPVLGTDSLDFMYFDRSSSWLVPFTPRSSAATTEAGAFVTRGRPAEILEYGVDGELRRVFRIEGAGRPVTQAMIDTFIDLERSRRPTTYASVPRSSWHGIYEDIGIPDRLPAFQSLQVDELGWLWAEVYDVDPSGPRDWVVFDPDGRAHGTVRTPPDLEIQWIGRDAVLGVWRDELEVEYVHRYRLTREPDPGR